MTLSREQILCSYIEPLEALEGNWHLPRRDPATGASLGEGILIAQKNTGQLLRALERDQRILEALVVPFLKINQAQYELLYYETDIEIIDGPTYVVPYNEKNCLPKEIVDKISLRLKVNRNDFPSFISFLRNYFAQMETMEFKEDKAVRKLFKKHPKIYYEFY